MPSILQHQPLWKKRSWAGCSKRLALGSPLGADPELPSTLRGARWAPGAGLLGASAGREPHAAFPAAAAPESRAELQIQGIPQLRSAVATLEIGKLRAELDLEGCLSAPTPLHILTLHRGTGKRMWWGSGLCWDTSSKQRVSCSVWKKEQGWCGVCRVSRVLSAAACILESSGRTSLHLSGTGQERQDTLHL